MYACFAVSESAALRALLGEPRMLGMTPDTALVDLNAEVGSMSVCASVRVRVWGRGELLRFFFPLFFFLFFHSSRLKRTKLFFFFFSAAHANAANPPLYSVTSNHRNHLSGGAGQHTRARYARETTPALASMLRREAAAWWRGSASSLAGGESYSNHPLVLCTFNVRRLPPLSCFTSHFALYK